MTEKSYHKIDIAIEFLEAAIQMFLAHRDYFCVIHLAAAAAEVMDHHLPKDQCKHDRAWKAQFALHVRQTGKPPTDQEINDVLRGAKNAIKHMNDNQDSVVIDRVSEAEWWLEFALSIHHSLKLGKTKTIWAFVDYQNQRTSRMMSELRQSPSKEQDEMRLPGAEGPSIIKGCYKLTAVKDPRGYVLCAEGLVAGAQPFWFSDDFYRTAKEALASPEFFSVRGPRNP